jgi:parvulin-like peptidyl-prolyl isomerase
MRVSEGTNVKQPIFSTGRRGRILRTILREPLLHFAVLGLAIFLVFAALKRPNLEEPGRIVVTAAKIEQIAGLFRKTRQRPPTREELRGLVDDHVKEEVYYREAIALGLDKDDTVIRRRLRLKMEFLADAAVQELSPGDAALEAYLAENRKKFWRDAEIAFRHVFLSAEKHGERVDEQAGNALKALLTGADPASLGDGLLLPSTFGPTPARAIDRNFGRSFAAALAEAPLGTWSGPIRSTYGLHLVFVGERIPGRLPALAEISDAVLREWTSDRRKEIEDARLQEILKRYEVTIESPGKGPEAASRS